jgi:hypothetical protein
MKKNLLFAGMLVLAACAGEKKEEAATPAADTAAMTAAPAPAATDSSAMAAPTDTTVKADSTMARDTAAKM